MKTLVTALMCACMALAAGGAAAQDAKKADAMAKDSTKKMTMQECKDYMATVKKDAKKDDAAMKKDAMCAEVMKDDTAMKKDAAPAPKK